jgi:thiamine phosphate synthase YjbQ (UPF0047 family)
MRQIVEITTDKREILVDITQQVADVVTNSGIANGLVSVYAQGATGAIMIQENWDQSVQNDVGSGNMISRTAMAMPISRPGW